MATVTTQPAPPAIDSTAPVDSNDVLNMHKDRISANELDLKDPYVAAALGLYAIHNVIRRNLISCSEHAKKINKSNVVPFVSYAKYTLYMVRDHLEAVDTLWFPKFGSYDPRFEAQIATHSALIDIVAGIEKLLGAEDVLDQLGALSNKFSQLSEASNTAFDEEERLSCELGHRVPLEEIQELEKKQEERRMEQVKTHGHLWPAVYLLRGLAPKERAIFPPGIPKMVVSGMLTAGALQFRKELQFSPKF